MLLPESFRFWWGIVLLDLTADELPDDALEGRVFSLTARSELVCLSFEEMGRREECEEPIGKEEAEIIA